MRMTRDEGWVESCDREDDPGRVIRLAQQIWRRYQWPGPPVGPHLIAAMERWQVPTQVITFDRARAILGAACPQKPQRYDAELVSTRQPDGTLRYLVIYYVQRPLTRMWWSLAHEFGHILLGHAENPPTRHVPRLDRQADMFAAELLMPLGAIMEVRQQSAEWIAERFGVSLQAAANRLEDLKRGWLRYYTLEELEAGRNLLGRLPAPPARKTGASHHGPRGEIPPANEEVRQDPMTDGSDRTPTATDGALVTWVIAQGGREKFPKLAACPVCGFVNDSPYAEAERFCGGCGQLLINACERAECAHHQVPLPPGYRYCGMCGQPTSWHDLDAAVRRTAQAQWEAENDSVPLPDDLPF